MCKTALLVVDVQTALLNEYLYHANDVLDNIKHLILSARKYDVPVVYIRHDAGVGSPLEKQTAGWQIAADIAPENGDVIIDKHFNSAFKETGLDNRLKEEGVNTIVLVGLQTDYCIDATCKVAFELGYKVIIPSGATSTFSNDYFSAEQTVNYFEKCIWQGRFATVVTMAEALKRIGTPN